MDDPVVSMIRYVRADNEALQTEKAYILNYTTPPDVPTCNFIINLYSNIKIHNLRIANLNFADNGITTAQLPKCMPKEDFDDEDKIEKCYLPEVHECIRETLGAEGVYIFDYMIRKREAAFPFQAKPKDNAPQPALSAHIDYTTDEINGRIHKYSKSKPKNHQSLIVVSLFLTVAYSYMYLLFTTFTGVFEETYEFNMGEAGLSYLGLGAGFLLGQ